MGGFIHSLHTQDFELMKISLKDYLVEQFRSDYVPAFNEIKSVADLNNTICCSISSTNFTSADFLLLEELWKKTSHRTLNRFHQLKLASLLHILHLARN